MHRKFARFVFVWHWHIGHSSPLPHQYNAVIKEINGLQKYAKSKRSPGGVVLAQNLNFGTCTAEPRKMNLYYGMEFVQAPVIV